mmetsp:Transcript_16426/g.32624  ORF Transcript_16426/g.32624 Transcript_16426/m.32624 type:complete len:143 (+) Transcript_16426:221-649(+)
MTGRCARAERQRMYAEAVLVRAEATLAEAGNGGKRPKCNASASGRKRRRPSSSAVGKNCVSTGVRKMRNGCEPIYAPTSTPLHGCGTTVKHTKIQCHVCGAANTARRAAVAQQCRREGPIVPFAGQSCGGGDSHSFHPGPNL